MNLTYEMQKEEALIKLYKVFDKEFIDNAFVEIFKNEDSNYKVISFMDDLFELALVGDKIDEEYIHKYWNLYKRTLNCNTDALLSTLQEFSRAARNPMSSISKAELLRASVKIPLWKRIFQNKRFLKFVGLLVIVYGTCFLWMGLELYFYNEAQPRMVDNLIAIILWYSLYVNWSRWVNKKFNYDWSDDN